MTTPIGRTVAMSRDASDQTVVDDLTAERQLGSVHGDLTPLLLDRDGETYIIFAGEIMGDDRPRFVSVQLPHVELMCPVLRGAEHLRTPHDGVWMTFPEPFEPGMTITAVWQDEDRNELFRIDSPPLTADRLDPLFGPEWTPYAPLDE
jgi:hypothetical protein